MFERKDTTNEDRTTDNHFHTTQTGFPAVCLGVWTSPRWRNSSKENHVWCCRWTCRCKVDKHWRNHGVGPWRLHFFYSLERFIPPTDGRDLRDFYHHWTNSILQHLTRKFWKIPDTFFRISSITNSFKWQSRWFLLTLLLKTGPSKLFEFPEISEE